MSTRLHDTATRIIEVLYLVIVLVAFAVVIIAANAYGASTDRFVQMLERREGMFPGQTKVVPECSCTIRYLGTSVRGRLYDVHIERLD